MNKKGNLTDVPVIIFMLFFIGIFAIVVLKVFTSYSDALANDTNIRTETRTSMAQASSVLPSIFDFLFMIMFIGLPLSSAFLAYFNNISPVLFYASLALVIMFVLVGASVQQVYENANTNTHFANITSQMPMMNYVFNHFALYTFFVFVIIALATFVRIRQDGAL